jgi:hypothetical protein
VTLIGCPKLDAMNDTAKLVEILTSNTIDSVTVVRMDVPCCKGIEQAVLTAVRESGKIFPCAVRILSPQGRLSPEIPLKPESGREDAGIRTTAS